MRLTENPDFLDWLEKEAGKAQLEAEEYKRFLSRPPAQRGTWRSNLRPETALIVYQRMTPREAVLAVFEGRVGTQVTTRPESDESKQRTGPASPAPPPPQVSYPTREEYCGSRHPEIYKLHTDRRTHPYTGEAVLEIMWDDRLPKRREFIPVSEMSEDWSGVKSQGVALPMELRREGEAFRLRWLRPPTPLPPPALGSGRPSPKVMLGLDGADKRPTFELVRGIVEHSHSTDAGFDALVKAAAVLVSASAAAVTWWRQRGQRGV